MVFNKLLTRNKRVLAMGLGLSLVASIATNTTYASMNSFEQGLRAIEKNDNSGYQRATRSLNSKELVRLLEGEYIAANIDKLSNQKIANYLESADDYYVSQKIRHQWLYHLLRDNQTQLFKQHMNSAVSDPLLICKGFQYGVLKADKEKALSLWLTSQSRPEDCDPVFKSWLKSGLLDNALVWQRIDKMMEAGQPGRAGFVAKNYLSANDARLANHWIDVANNPERLGQLYPAIKESNHRDLIVETAIKKLAKASPGKAASLWLQWDKKYDLPESLDNKAWAQIGFWAAVEDMPQAIDWLLKSKSIDDENVMEWSVRAALKNRDWKRVISFIERMPADLAQSPMWQYWIGRAYEQTGNEKQAKKHYQSIADGRGFYEFMAADKVNQAYKIQAQPPFDRGLKSDFEKSSAFKLSKDLYQMGDFIRMRLQWSWAIRDLDNEGLKSAAELAHKWGLYDRGIITATQAQYWDAVHVRFPLAWEKDVRQAASQQNLPAALVYGIIRQESAFMDEVSSSAGAIGLMQIMPATGKDIARQMKMPAYNTRDLLNPEKNIAMGSHYIKGLLNKFDGVYPLAIAGYNAGRGNASKWHPNNHTDADIWIETIPFKETRNYVKRVLTYTMIYQSLLDEKGGNLASLTNQIKAKRN